MSTQWPLLHPAAARGIEAYNRRDFFEAHEHLETAWIAERSPLRNLYRGILQLGLAYYQIQRGNFRGAIKMFLRAQEWLDMFPDQTHGVNVASLREDRAHGEACLRALTSEHIAYFPASLIRPVLPSPQETDH